MKESDVLRPDAQDFETIKESWDKNFDDFYSDITSTNEAILDGLNDLEDICIFEDKFDEFLDEINLVVYSNHVEVSSYYSDYKSRVFCWDDAYELVTGYVEEIVRRGDIILADFDLWDDTFVYSINDKFGYDDYEEEETTEEDQE